MMSEELTLEIEDKLAESLAYVYMRIPWSKLNIKSAHKFFVDRIRASSNSKDFKDFLDVFTMKCNVEFVRINKEVFDFLNKYTGEVMQLLRKDSTYIANYALDKVETLKEKAKLEKQGQTTL